MNPSSITGGCLCGGVRYEVNFAPDHDFKKDSHNCQCTQCRKQTGSLLIHWHTVTIPELRWTSKSTFGVYDHTPGIHRFFCTKCGGILAWQDEKEGNNIEFTVGTVDEIYLIGDRASDEEETPRTESQGYGSALADSSGRQFWSSKTIKGVTDKLQGPKA